MTSRKRTTGGTRGSWGRAVVAVFLILICAAIGGAAFVMLTPYGPQKETFVEILP